VRKAHPVMSLQTKILTPAIGAVVEGLDLSVVTGEQVAVIREKLDQHLVLFFEGQHLTPAQQRDFAARFGELYLHPFYAGHEEANEVMVLAHDEKHRANSDRWHNDVTYLEKPPQAAVLYTEVIPPVGGDTLFANMYSAYEALSPPMKDFVATLRAEHSFAKNFTPQRFDELGIADRRDEIYAKHPPVSHPVARTNPATGRKALFINQDFTTNIEGITARESETLMRFLFDHMAQPEFQVRWRWQPNTVAMWDNRWAQHCALADYFPQRRVVRRATILGDRPV
jgi:taurine dioxygenase